MKLMAIIVGIAVMRRRMRYCPIGHPFRRRAYGPGAGAVRHSTV
jgi:hypothetical protein